MKLRRYAQLTDALSKTACENLIEVGTWNGHRAKELSSAALRRNASVRYHGFDLFEALTEVELKDEFSRRPPSQAEVDRRLGRFQRRVSILSTLRPWKRRSFSFRLYQGFTRETLPAFKAASPNFRAQFIFIDGGHSIETIRNDWEHCADLVDDSGAIFMDDFYANDELAERFGCNTLVETLKGDPRWEVVVLPESDTVEGIATIRIVRASPV
jgi:hypothetical protein